MKRPQRRHIDVRKAAIGLVTTLVIALGLALPAFSADTFDQVVAPLFNKFCIHCHGKDGEIQAKVNLVSIRRPLLERRPEMTRALLDVLERGQMPPKDELQPSAADRKRGAKELRTILRASLENTKFTRTPIRRMNRFQYNNAVQDLFELNCIVLTLPERMMREHQNYFRPETGKMADVVRVGSRPLGKSQMIEARLAGVAPFPQDLRAEHGFDNRGDHLSLSPLLLQSFMQLSRSIIDSPDFGPKTCGIWPQFFAEPPNLADLAKSGDEFADIVRGRLRPFLTRAFRRELDAMQLERYTQYALQRLATGDSFTETMKSVAAATIASPRFLYLYETAPLSRQRARRWRWGSVG